MWDEGGAALYEQLDDVELIVGLGYLVPILVLATVAWVLVRRLRRRRAA